MADIKAIRDTKSKRLEIRMTPGEMQDLEECADRMHISRTDVLNLGVRMIKDHLEGRDSILDQAFAQRVESAGKLARRVHSVQLALFQALYENPVHSKKSFIDAFDTLNDMTADLKSDLGTLTDDMFARLRAAKDEPQGEYM